MISGRRGLVEGDGAATQVDAGVGVAREVVDALGRVVEADGRLEAGQTQVGVVAGAQHDGGRVDEGVVHAEGERQSDAVLDDQRAVEEVLTIVDVDDAELAVPDGQVTRAGVQDGVGRGHREGRAEGAVDLRAQGARVVLDDGKGAGAAEDDAAVAEALHVGDDLARVDVDLADGGAGPHEREGAETLFIQEALAAVHAAGIITVEVLVLENRQALVGADVDARAGAGAGVPEIGREFGIKGLKVADRLTRPDLQHRVGGAGQVAGAPLGPEGGVGRGVEFRQRGLTVGGAADEVDGSGLPKRQPVGVVEGEVAARDEHVTRQSTAVEDGERPGAGLVETPGAVDTANRADHAGVKIGVQHVVGVFAHIEDGVDVGAVDPGLEVGQGAGIKVVDEIKAEEQGRRRVAELAVAENRALRDDVVRGVLETERGVPLDDDGLGPDHLGGEAGGREAAVISPLVEVAAGHEHPLIDHHDAREGALRTEVVREVRVVGEGVVAEIVDVLESVVLQGPAAGLHEDRDRGEGGAIERRRREVVAEQLHRRGRGDLLVEREDGAHRADRVTHVQRGDRPGEFLDLRRGRQAAGRAEVGDIHHARQDVADEGLREVGLRGRVVDGHVGAGGGQGDQRGGGQDEEAAGEFHCGRVRGRDGSGRIRSGGDSRPRCRWSWSSPTFPASASGNTPCRGSAHR